MKEPKIEKGIPIPSQGRGKYKRLADEMKVGDSVLFIDKGVGYTKEFANINATKLTSALRKNGMKACQRIMKKSDNEPTETRVWRTE